VFQDLDATLKALLTDAAAPADLRDADVGFDRPDKDYRPAQATLNLFLYEVTENRTLRDNARVLAAAADAYTSRLPSMRVDCTYLATTWSTRAAGLQVEEEHRLLGLALIWLNRFPAIEDRFLRGTLKTPPQPYPPPMVAAQTRDGQAAGHFWSALGVPPRAAFSITVTVSADPFDRVEHFPAMRSVRIKSVILQGPATGPEA
jgi:Pvc16 N-terminal domain